MADITVMNKQEQEINTGATQENTATQPLPVEPVTPVPSYVEGLTEDGTRKNNRFTQTDNESNSYKQKWRITMSDEFKDVSTVPTLTLKPFQEEEKRNRWCSRKNRSWTIRF